jgi:hypothetical protein
MHMWHHVTNHLIISTDKDSNSENRIKLRVRDKRQPTGRGDCGRQPCVLTHHIHPYSGFCLYRRSLAPCVINQGVLVLLDRHLHITLSLA